MTMRKNNPNILLVSMFVLSLLLASCVDKDYDLSKDIDLTIHVGGNALALPVGSTDSIKLNKIIKVDESDVLHLSSGGEYSLLKEDVVDPINVTVPSVDPISMNPIFLSTLLYQAGSNASSRASGSIDIPVSSDTTFLLSRSGMPTEVSSIKTITIPGNGAKANIRFNLTGVTSAVNFSFKNFKLTFPDFVVSPQLNSNHELILNEPLTSGLTKAIYITSYDFSHETGGALAIKNQLLQLEKKITVSGVITASNLNTSTVTGDVNLKTMINIEPATISEVEGKIDPAINVKIDPISLDIPDFLKDDAVTMDVQDPMIRLNVTNETAIPIILNGQLQGYRDGKLISSSLVNVKGTEARPITVKASGQTMICLSRTGKSGTAGSDKYEIADLNNLIEKIPDQIKFTMNAHADQISTHKIQLGRNYAVKMDYAVEVPFKFGSGLSIVYNDSIDNLNKDIKDLDIKSISLTMTVENNIPLALKLEAIPVGLDKSAGALPDISVLVTGEIKPCDASGKTQESPVSVKMTTTSGAFKNLDGLMLKITATSTTTVNGMPLKESQYLRLKDIKAKASEGMDIDLNDK